MKSRFDGLPRETITGVFFRCVSKKHAKKPFDTLGSLERGGRFNPPVEFAALYLSDSEEICRAEVKRRNPNAKDTDYPVFPVELSIDSVLDLTNDKIRKKLLLRHNDDLADNEYLNTQALAKAAREVGYKAILAPSVTGEGTNLVVFVDKIEASDELSPIVERKPK